VPTLQIMGWFDNIAPWQWDDHQRLAQRPDWSRVEYLHIDAVDHEIYHHADTPITEATDHDVNPAALEALLPRYVSPALEFFDVFLRESRPAESLPKVRWRPVHGDWKSAETWPPPGAVERTLYLGDGGVLADQAPEQPSEVSWTHDPDDLVPSRVDNPFAFLQQYPDERAYAERADVIEFSAPPVSEPIELAGPIELSAVVRSTGPVMDLFVRLLDVGPDGAARYVARGQLVVDPAQHDTPVQVSLCHTGYVLRRGHALRLHLAGSDFPEYVPHPGTGANRWLAQETQANRLTLHLGGDQPARLTITALLSG
jgi:putative CocE/NonD family hydrolase